MDELPWVRMFQRRCRAVLEPRWDTKYWGRCELAAGHGDTVDHALERGKDTPSWSTRPTSY